MPKLRISDGVFVTVDEDILTEAKMYKWHLNAYGYPQRTSTKEEMEKGAPRKTFLHRAIMGFPKGLEVDHINGDILDCRRSNLRVCTRMENSRNQKKMSGTSSKYKGVYWAKDREKWRATICHEGKRIHLGTFPDEVSAANAYNAAAKELHGDFSLINEL